MKLLTGTTRPRPTRPSGNLLPHRTERLRDSASVASPIGFTTGTGVSIAMGLAAALVLDAGGQTDHKLSSRLETVDFEGAAKLADS